MTKLMTNYSEMVTKKVITASGTKNAIPINHHRLRHKKMLSKLTITASGYPQKRNL